MSETPWADESFGHLTTTGRVTGRRVVDPDEDELARAMVHDKYRAGYGGDLSDWRRRSAPVAIDLEVGEATPA
ncbi:MAG: hypothetical protein ACRDJP_04435 [Actinomycetota bacterium]